MNLGQVLELDSFTLEDGAFHVLDHFFLLLTELVVAELHAMDFLTHGDDLGLTDLWVQSILHFFLQHDLTLPKQDLPLSLHDLSQNLSLFFLLLRDLVLKFDALVFKFLQLRLELELNIPVAAGQLQLIFLVHVVDIVQLVHLEVQVLQGDLQLSDLPVVALHSVVQSHLLLLQDALLIPQFVSLLSNLHLSCLLVDQGPLVSDPPVLCLRLLVLQFLNVLLNRVFLVFQGPLGLFAVAVVLHVVGEGTVEPVNFQLLRRNLGVSLLDLLLSLIDISFLLLEFFD